LSTKFRSLTQLDRVPVFETGSRGFESCRAGHIDTDTKRIYNVVMYKVEWKDTAGRGCVEEVIDLSAALAFAKELGIPVTINGGGMEIVGVFGADGIENGQLPNGDRYGWYKRRRP
jgi:hypothetical protein